MSSPAGNRANAVTLGFTVIAGAIVFLRLFTRLVLVRKTGFEDGCIAFAMILSIGLAIGTGAQARSGMGMHIYDLSENQMIDSQKAFWASVWLYNLCLTVTKISILVQYLRIFPTRRFRIVCYVMLGIVIVYGVWTLFGSIFICFPVSFFWNKTIPGGKCLNQFTVWFTNAAVNIAQDLVILLLPIAVLRNLSIPRRQKRAVMIVFALGGFVCLISIIRLQSLVRISNSPDPTFDNPPAANFSTAEANVGIICACLPYMRPLLSIMFPAYFPESASRYVRTFDEEHMRPTSASSRPYPAGEKPISRHSRGGSNVTLDRIESNTSEMNDMYKPQSTRTATFVKGHARKVTIGSSIGSARMLSSTPDTSRLPKRPEEAFVFGSLEQVGTLSNVSRSVSSPRPQQQYHPITPLARKALPVTPFPIAHTGNR